MRSKPCDIKTLIHFIDVLQEFKKEKGEKWEKIDDEVQAKNRPATPTEDWIIPPDENETEKILMKDEKYRKFKSEIKELRPKVETIAQFLGKKQQTLSWLQFDSPLIGNAALEDSIQFGINLLSDAKRTNYFLQNLKHLF